jgi:hypothetical protein
MRKNYLINGCLIAMIIYGMCSLTSCNQSPVSPESYLGRWSLYLPGGAGWLGVSHEAGYYDAELLWYGGSVVPVADVYFVKNYLVVTRISRVVRGWDEAGVPARIHHRTESYKFLLTGEDELKGTAIFINEDGLGVTKTEFTAKRIPDLPPQPDLSVIKYGEPQELFNGKDLSGWQLMEADRKNGFTVDSGVLINKPVHVEGEHGGYGNLRTTGEYNDFKLNLQVNIPAGSNSGIYLRGIYEVQVMDSYQKPLDPHNMGAVYSRITPSVAAEKPAGEWQDFEIILYKRHVTVTLNGIKIIDNKPLNGITGGAITADEFIPGPLYLQGDHGEVAYRDIVITPILE